jgi:hypothetical protein
MKFVNVAHLPNVADLTMQRIHSFHGSATRQRQLEKLNTEQHKSTSRKEIRPRQTADKNCKHK